MLNYGIGKKAGLLLVLIVLLVWFHTTLTGNKFDDNAEEFYQKIEQKSFPFLKLSKQEKMRKNFGAIYWREYDNRESQTIVIENMRSKINEIGWQVNEEFLQESTGVLHIKGSCDSEWNFHIKIELKSTVIELSI